VHARPPYETPAGRLLVYESLYALNRDFEQVLAHLRGCRSSACSSDGFRERFPRNYSGDASLGQHELVEALQPLEQDDLTHFSRCTLTCSMKTSVGRRSGGSRPERKGSESGLNRRRIDWRTHSCVPRRDSSRRLVLNLYHRRTSVEMSLDTARTSACATVRQSVLAVQPLEAEDEFEEPAVTLRRWTRAEQLGRESGNCARFKDGRKEFAHRSGLHRADVGVIERGERNRHTADDADYCGYAGRRIADLTKGL